MNQPNATIHIDLVPIEPGKVAIQVSQTGPVELSSEEIIVVLREAVTIVKNGIRSE